MQNNNERFEDLLDRALSDYSGAEPLAGLEERILNRIRGVHSAPDKRAGWRFALGGMLLVSISTAVFLRMRPDGRVQAPVVTRFEALAAPIAILKTQPPQKLRRVVAKSALPPKHLPKREQFPTPSPLSQEERALLAFARNHPSEAQQAFADLEEQSRQPVVIAPIEIAPLEENNP